MGSKSCKLSGDKVEVKSPILGCIIEHCTCSCAEEQKPEEQPKDPKELEAPEDSPSAHTAPKVSKVNGKKKKKKKATVKDVIPN